MNPDERADFLREWKSMHTPIGPRAILDVVSPDVKDASASVVAQLHKSALPENLWQLTNGHRPPMGPFAVRVVGARATSDKGGDRA